MWVYFWVLYSVLLTHGSVFVIIPHCFNYCTFVVQSEVWESYASCSSIFPQDCFGNSMSFMVPCKFLDYSSCMKNVMGNLIGITLNLYTALGSVAILTILILPIQEYGKTFHCFKSPSISFSRGSFRPRDQTQVSCIAGRFFTI